MVTRFIMLSLTFFYFSISTIPAQAANGPGGPTTLGGKVCDLYCDEPGVNYGDCMRSCRSWLGLAGPDVKACLEKACPSPASCSKSALKRCGMPAKSQSK
jgi:hypothetical protein